MTEPVPSPAEQPSASDKLHPEAARSMLVHLWTNFEKFASGFRHQLEGLDPKLVHAVNLTKDKLPPAA